ncbi:MAG: DMT family transporter [Alphaproteobacteria bacterium]|nr:DMT family transporter [Alphaproteobacteria bacterium]
MLPRALTPPVIAVLLSLTTAATGSIMNCLIRVATEELHPFEVAFFRNLFGFLTILPFAFANGLGTFRAHRPGRLFLAALVNLFSMMSFFSAVALMPLNELTALSFTQPLFQTVGAALILGEAVRRWRWIGTLIGFIGVLIVVRPGTEAFTPVSLLVLFGASTYAAVALIIKSVADTESSITTVLYVSFMISCLSLPVAATVWTWPSAQALAMTAAIGALGTTGWFAFAYAFKLADASALASYDFTRLPFIAVPAYLIFDEIPDLWTWVGAAVIFASSVLVTRAEARRGREAKPAETGSR